MGRLWSFIRAQEPAAVAGVVVALLLAAGTFGLPVTEAQAKSLGLVATLVLTLVVRTAVVSPATAITVAAEAAATTASRLSSTAAGKVGEVTATAGRVVSEVTAEAGRVVAAPTELVGKVVDRVLPAA